MEISNILGINRLLDKFSRDVNDVYDYEFRCTTPSDFELKLVFTAKSVILRSVFEQVKKHLVRQDTKFSKLHGSNSDVIQSFEIPAQFNNRVHTSISKQVKAIEKIVNKDGIKILRTQVDNCRFVNNEDKTEIHILVGGIYGR